MPKTINDAGAVIRMRVNDRDKINYSDEEIVADVATACRYLSQVLIARKSPEMIAVEDVVDYAAVPENFHSFVGQWPVWREGLVFRTSTGANAVTVRYWATRGQGLSSLTDVIPFDEIYFDAIVTAACMLLMNRDEFDTTKEQSILQALEALAPGGAAK
ncbi:MAG: hypothetical protein J5974_06475 [Pyramidobacter sp.]|nr:hypothetical protein [Pyramidobacter sp.]